MNKTELLLARLEEIGRSLAQTERALALIGLGSVGLELHRLDAYSDLDFFVVVEAGSRSDFLTDLRWLSSVRPVVYQFRNSEDGYKLLFDDDVFCEFAVFEAGALAGVPFAPGRVVWKRPHVDDGIGRPARASRGALRPDSAWLVGEALTNLYVGLGRYHRGEKLSAVRFIQQYAVDRIVELSGMIEAEQPVAADPFTPERRYELRFPATARPLASFIQGYERSRESAEAILVFLEQHFEVNAHLARRIRELCDVGGQVCKEG
jgi:lincosamide nucleotidyltransferase B/F